MMKRLLAALAIVLTLALTGCGVFSQPEVVAGCQAADAVTTTIALGAGATEANPLVAGIISNVGIAGFLIVKALVAWALIAATPDAPEAVEAVTAATCGIAAHNVLFF